MAPLRGAQKWTSPELTEVYRQPRQLPPRCQSITQRENREVVQAVKALNETEMFGQDNQLRFQKDPRTGRIVVKVVNNKTNEVVSQIPAEYLLSLAQDLKQTKA